ncbi:MAG TPA: universal stress protein [Smithellaceae bacterium]|nr:universal stress protein [Smithellaceae bacterium]HRS88187.1 universal stress protein [Smithellaceae bacterium]HRV25705.1 universal stress protein [Smithellaceae bacterium]
MIGEILIPVDGSANSFKALDYGIYIAKKLGAAITGLYVLDANLIQGPMLTDISGSVGMPPYDGFFEAIETSLNEKADFILKDFQQRCRQAGLNAQTKKTIGKIGPAIIEEGQEADLIIMAKKGEHFHLREGGLLGSVAEAVVRNSGKPVMVTPENYLEIESMAVAFDGSEPAKKALCFSLRLADKTAWPLTAIIISADEKKTAALSGEVESMLEDQTIDADVIIMQGKEAEEITKYLKEGAVELLAMGAFGHNRLRALLMGSTTSQIIRKSPVPVLLTR